MSRKQPVDYHDFRKKISNPGQLSFLRTLSDEWSLSVSELCWRFITDRITTEKKKKNEVQSMIKNGTNG